MSIEPLSAERDAEACDVIVRSLPYHFGIEEGRVACAAAVRAQSGLVARANDGLVVGFLTVAEHFDHSAEVTWMAVHAAHRHHGIGRALVVHLSERLRQEGRRVLIAFTVSSSDPGPEPDDGYQVTRAFYRGVGFVEARDIPELWPGDTAVLMVLAL
jgi:ribosomal protein S18 acetylase RimI-like enzyme